jgi:hypothetical protein
MVRAHYPLIDFTRFTNGYPMEVGVQEAEELRGPTIRAGSDNN